MIGRQRGEKMDGVRRTPKQGQEPAALNERLLHALIAISGCATLEEVLEPLLDAALDVTRMDGGGVYWVEGDIAVLRYHRGLPEAFTREVARMPLPPPPIQVLLDQVEPVELADLSLEMRERLARHGIRHAFSFPLQARGILFGFLNIGTTLPDAPDRADIQALQLLVHQVESLFFRLYTERALRESEQRYRTLWESALDGVVLHERLSSPQKGRFIDVNDGMCRMLGYSREELLKLSPFDLVDDQGKKQISELVPQIAKAGRLLLETTLITRDDRHIPVEVNAHVIELAGQSVVMSIVRDISERMQIMDALRDSEERFRVFMDNSPTIAWMKDEQGRHVYLNRTAEEHYRIGPEDWRGKTDFDLWPREVAEEFRKNDQEVLRTGQTLDVVEENLAPDGSRRYWRNFKFRFEDASGRRFVGGIGGDITQRRQMEQMLRQVNERLEEQVQARTKDLNETVDQLHATVKELQQRTDQLQKLTLELVQTEDRERRRLAEFLHDDLQQMLAAVKFHLGILGGRIRSDPTSREILEQSTQLLMESIAKSRNLSHELGPPVLYQGNLEAIFEWLAGQMARKHGLTVLVDVRWHANSDSEPVRSFLYRSAHEILFNIVKHAQIHEARLRLRRVRDGLRLTISDKGRGFDPTTLSRTAGFGLSTICERVELLGGRVAIRSAPGKGSTFLITVPDIIAPM